MDATQFIRPLWIPQDLVFDALPEGLQHAITVVVNPAYDEYVLRANLGNDMSPTLAHSDRNDAHAKKINWYLRIGARMDETARFLLDLKRFHERAGLGFPYPMHTGFGEKSGNSPFC